MSVILPRRFVPGGYPPVMTDVCGLDLSRFTTVKKQTTILRYGWCLSFSNDGLHMYSGHGVDRSVRNYKSTGNPWELDEQIYVGQFSPDTGPENMQNTTGIAVKPDGTELWIAGYTGLIIGNIVSYSLSVPYEWTSLPSKIGSIPVGIGGVKIYEDINIKPDGTRIIGWGNAGTDPGYQLDMSTWDVTTLAYNSVSTTAIQRGSFVPSGGGCIYKGVGRVIEKSTLSSPWELGSIGSVVDSLDLTSLITSDIQSLFITNDRLFVLTAPGSANSIIYQFNA